MFALPIISFNFNRRKSRLCCRFCACKMWLGIYRWLRGSVKLYTGTIMIRVADTNTALEYSYFHTYLSSYKVQNECFLGNSFQTCHFVSLVLCQISASFSLKSHLQMLKADIFDDNILVTFWNFDMHRTSFHFFLSM